MARVYLKIQTTLGKERSVRDQLRKIRGVVMADLVTGEDDLIAVVEGRTCKGSSIWSSAASARSRVSNEQRRASPPTRKRRRGGPSAGKFLAAPLDRNHRRSGTKRVPLESGRGPFVRPLRRGVGGSRFSFVPSRKSKGSRPSSTAWTD